MSEKYTIDEKAPAEIVAEEDVVDVVPTVPLHLDITLEDNAVVADIKKALKMIKGIASVKVAHPKADNVITPALAKKIEKAHHDYAAGNYTECKTEEELTAFLESL